MGICTHGPNVKTNILSETLDNFPKIHTEQSERLATKNRFSKISASPHRLKYQTKMSTMLKCSFQANDVFFVVRINLSQFIKNLNLL